MKKILRAVLLTAIMQPLFHFNTTAQANPAQPVKATTGRNAPLDSSPLTIDADERDSTVKYITTWDNGSEYRLTLKKGQVTDLYAGAQRIAEKDLPRYQRTVDSILEKAKRGQEQVAAQTAAMKRQQIGKTGGKASLGNQQAQLGSQQATLSQQQALEAKKHAERVRLVNALVDELVARKIVQRRQDVTSLQLSTTGLTVNGKQQPSELFDRLKAEYLKDPEQPLKYVNGLTY